MDRKTILSVYADAVNIFIWLFVFSFVATELVLPKTCTNVDTFRVSFGKSFEACIEECQRRKRCEIVMYKHGINECSLKDFINTMGLKEEKPVCLFTNITDWERTGLGPCDKNSCEITETCVTSSTDPNIFECVKSECPKPPEINNAKVLSAQHGIGYKNGYKCDQMFIGKGDPFITCKNDGKWSTTNFQCVKLLNKRAFKLNLQNADFITFEGEHWIKGRKILYACRPGYQGRGLTASSVLHGNWGWSPRVVQCCNENITQYFWGHSCIATFNGSFASTFEDMVNHCMTIGGYMRQIDPGLSNHIFMNEGYQWLISVAKKTSFRRHLEECVRVNNISDLKQNFANISYDDLIVEVISRNLTNLRHCKTAEWWAPNEPNGGDVEQCVLFRKGTNLMVDVDCSSFIFAGRPDTGFICNYNLPTI